MTLGAKPVRNGRNQEMERRRSMMKKTFAVVLLVSAATVACGGKKASTTPAGKAPMESGSTGGAAYGGAAYAGGVHKDAPPAGKDTPNPCAPK
jgi:hypothetical protein